MEHLELNNTIYGFTRDFKHDPDIRKSFNKLTKVIFGFNLEEWYQNGFWTDNYIPYSLLHNNEVISNVSVNKIEFDIENKRRTGIQIGTVMTDKRYRHNGLNKFLLQQVVNDWSDRSDFIYLFANDSVLDFYPKFNFEKVDEYQYSKLVNTHNTPSSFKRLNMDDENDKALLIDTINSSIPMSKISMRNNVPLIMFYCMSFKKNSIFYVEKLKTILIADFEGDILYLNDVFSKKPVELDNLIQVISSESTKKVVLGFTPLNGSGFNRSLLKEGDTLFMLKDKANYFKDNHRMFPVLSHA